MSGFRQIMFIFILITVAACGQETIADRRTKSVTDDTFEQILKNNRIVAGYVVVPPWIIKDPNTGILSGSSVDAMREIARLANFDIEFRETTWGAFLTGLQSSQFDISIVPAFVSVPRAKAALFTRPITFLGNTVLVRSNETRFKNISDLNNESVRISLTKGEQGNDYARLNLPKAQLNIISSNDITTVFNEVLSNRADAALADTYYINRYAAAHPQVRDLLPNRPYSVLAASWLVRSNDVRLKYFLDTSIMYLEGAGILEALDRKYGIPSVQKQAVDN